MHRPFFAKRLWITLMAAAFSFACLSAQAAAYTLGDALRLVGTPTGREDNGMVELKGDFSQYDLFGGGDYEVADGGFIILWREAPLKRFVTSSTPFADDYEGDDIGSPRVYLCTELMESIPAFLRAASEEEAANVIMAETLYYHSGVIYTSSGGKTELPSVWELEAVMAGGEGKELEQPEDEPQIMYAYRPVFTCIAAISLYNRDTLGSAYLEGNEYPHAELRNNPAAGDQWEKMTLLVDVAAAAGSEGETPLRDTLDALEAENFLLPAELDHLIELAEGENADAIINLCLERFWVMAEKLKTLDAGAAELLDKAIAARSLQGIYFIVNARAYTGVRMDDEVILLTESYTGHPDLGALKQMLADTIEGLGLTGD